jgi:hypothetical protein
MGVICPVQTPRRLERVQYRLGLAFAADITIFIIAICIHDTFAYIPLFSHAAIPPAVPP